MTGAEFIFALYHTVCTELAYMVNEIGKHTNHSECNIKKVHKEDFIGNKYEPVLRIVNCHVMKKVTCDARFI